MLRKFVALGLVGLFLVMSFVVAENGIGPYDLMADVNRDGTVDILDLTQVGQAYGSNLTLAHEVNRTVVTVLSFDRNPPEVENARVAIFDPETFLSYYGDAAAVNYTNSLGIATFDLDADKNYIAIAWSGSAYNYANFTTNSFGEACVLILLGELSLPPIRALPKGWVTVTLLDNETHELQFKGEYLLSVDYITGYEMVEGERRFILERIALLWSEGGILALPPDLQLNGPHSKWGLVLWYGDGTIVSLGTYSPDEIGCANVVLYVAPLP